ncbi:hypothetical protein P8452_69818 [Trifolium repens]|nr:hypothetical protein P8452_69818 [Trifolium repens]
MILPRFVDSTENGLLLLPSSCSLLWYLHSNFCCRKHDLLNPPKGEKLLLHFYCSLCQGRTVWILHLNIDLELSQQTPKMNKHQLWDIINFFGIHIALWKKVCSFFMESNFVLRVGDNNPTIAYWFRFECSRTESTKRIGSINWN